MLKNAARRRPPRRRSGTAISPRRRPGRAGARPPGSRRARRAARRAPGRPVSADLAASRSSRCAPLLARLTMRGARPSGWRLTRSDVHRRREQVRATPSVSSASAVVGGDQVPGAVDHDRRERLVAARAASRARRAPAPSGRVERVLRVGRRVARRRGAGVALAQRHVEGSARCSTISRLGRERPVSTKLRWRVETPASQREVELAQPAPRAPVAQQGPDRRGGRSAHGPSLASRAAAPMTSQVIDPCRARGHGGRVNRDRGGTHARRHDLVQDYIASLNESDPAGRPS